MVRVERHRALVLLDREIPVPQQIVGVAQGVIEEAFCGLSRSACLYASMASVKCSSRRTPCPSSNRSGFDRLEAERLLILADGEVELVEFGIGVAQVGVNGGVVAVQAERLLIALHRQVEATQTGVGDAKLEVRLGHLRIQLDGFLVLPVGRGKVARRP